MSHKVGNLTSKLTSNVILRAHFCSVRGEKKTEEVPRLLLFHDIDPFLPHLIEKTF